MTALAHAITRINARDVDLLLGTVTNGGAPPIALRPQSLAVLKLLAAKPGALVSKDDLMAAVWPRIAVTDDSLVQCITEIRKALGDEDHKIVKTVPRRGYVFEPGKAVAATEAKAPVVKTHMGLIAAGLAALVAIAAFFWFPKAAPLPGHIPSIAVLPFDDMSAEKNLSYLGDGVAEDIITMLSRFPDLSVVARNSSFTYKGKATDIRQVGKELGVGYVLEGSVRKERDEVRIVAQLVNAGDGKHVWAERFDKAGEDPSALQDEVTAKIVGTLMGEAGQIKRADYQRAWGKDSTNLEEYDYYLRGHDFFMRNTKDDFQRAVAIWREGLTKFPNSNLLKIKLGFYHFMSPFSFYSDNPDADYRKASELTREVLAAEPLTPQVARLAHALMAYVHLQERDFAKAIAEAVKAVALAPYDANMTGQLATVVIMSGRPDLGLEWTEKAIVRDASGRPRWNYRLGLAYSLKGENEKSIASLKEGPDWPDVPLLMAIGNLRLGRMEEAKVQYKKGLTIDPAFTQAKWREGYFYSDPSVVEGQIADLIKLGLPEK